MSTRSYICLEQNDGSIKGIYCHSDGYLTYNGAMLIDHYNSREKVEEMLNLGCLSCLCEKLCPNPTLPHGFDYDKRQEDVSVFYGRDRNEDGQEAFDVDLEDVEKDVWIEYCYIFGKDNQWRFFEQGSLKKGLVLVQEGLDKIYEDYGFPRPKGFYGFFSEDAKQRLRKEYLDSQSDMAVEL